MVNGHSLYQSVYLLEGRQLPLTPRMYRRSVTCEKEGVPFVSKIDMAYEEVTTFEPPPDTHTHLLIDSWYVAKRIWRAACQRGWDVTGGLKSNRVMRIILPDGTRMWMKVREYAATLTADDFSEVTWPTEEGGKVVYVHLVKTWVRKLGPCRVLIVRLDPNAGPEGTRYWVTTCLEESAEQIIVHVARRWVILDEIRAVHRAQQGEHLTLGQARQQVRESHQEALLDWLIAQVQAGVPRAEIHQALKPAMRL